MTEAGAEGDLCEGTTLLALRRKKSQGPRPAGGL